MKKLLIGFIAAVFSTIMLFPALQARAQEWMDQDMAHDSWALRHQQRNLGHDYWELQNDLARGDYGEAAHEQAEINHRRYDIERRQQDLNRDWYSRYKPYGYGAYDDDDD